MQQQLYITTVIFSCRHLAQEILVKITAAAFQITKRINTIVFVRRALQVFIARKVNKTIMCSFKVELLLF